MQWSGVEALANIQGRGEIIVFIYLFTYLLTSLRTSDRPCCGIFFLRLLCMEHN